MGRRFLRGWTSAAALAAAVLLVALAPAFVVGCRPKAPPPAPPGKYYHDADFRIELTNDERALIRALKTSLTSRDLPAPEVDSGLVVAARNLAHLLTELDDAEQGRLRNETIQQALLDAGVTDARFFSHISTAPDLDFLRLRLNRSAVEHFQQDAYSHCGIGIVRVGFPSRRVCVALFTQRIAHLGLYPKFLPDADSLALTGRVEEGYDAPTLLVTCPGGEIRQVPILLDEAREFLVDVPIEIGKKGRYTVEVAVESEGGPEMASLFPVDYLERPLTGTYLASSAAARKALARVVETEKPMAEGEAESLIVDLINDERRKAGLIPLYPDNRLAELARAHSLDMAKSGLVRHISPTSGDLTDRAKAAGIPYRKIGENIALNTTVRAAHASLLESPAHRQNMLDPEFRFVGVGVARQDGGGGQVQYVVTEHFADFDE